MNNIITNIKSSMQGLNKRLDIEEEPRHIDLNE